MNHNIFNNPEDLNDFEPSDEELERIERELDI